MKILLREGTREDFISILRELAQKDDRKKLIYHVHFSRSEKLGINPQQTDITTPTGIYAFPIGCYKKEILKNEIPEEIEFFLKSSYYAYILTPSENARLFRTSGTYPKLKEKIENMFRQYEKYIRDFPLNKGWGIYGAVVTIMEKPVSISMFFKKVLKFDVIVDDYGNVVHHYERYQSIFLPFPFEMKIVTKTTTTGREELLYRFPFTESSPEEMAENIDGMVCKKDVSYLRSSDLEEAERMIAEFYRKIGKKIDRKELFTLKKLLKQADHCGLRRLILYGIFPELQNYSQKDDGYIALELDPDSALKFLEKDIIDDTNLRNRLFEKFVKLLPNMIIKGTKRLDEIITRIERLNRKYGELFDREDLDIIIERLKKKR